MDSLQIVGQLSRFPLVDDERRSWLGLVAVRILVEVSVECRSAKDLCADAPHDHRSGVSALAEGRSVERELELGLLLERDQKVPPWVPR
jgi:hypothetical protein